MVTFVLFIELRDGTIQNNNADEAHCRTGRVFVLDTETTLLYVRGIDIDKDRIAFAEQSVMRQILGTNYTKEKPYVGPTPTLV
jgi:hypothetical protein